MTAKRRWWILVALLVVVGGCYILFWHGVTVRIPELPEGAQARGGTLRFDVVDGKVMATKGYNYYAIDVEEKGWRGLQEILKTGSVASGQIVMRVRAPVRSGVRLVPADVSGFFVLYPGSGGMAWSFEAGTVRSKMTRTGEIVWMQFVLKMVSYGDGSWPPPDWPHAAALWVRRTAFRIDRGAATNIFNAFNRQYVTGLEEWLREDPELADMLPCERNEERK